MTDDPRFATRKRYGSSRHRGRLLTQEEVDALPDGTKVVITWSGGNGPHEYVARRYEDADVPYAVTQWGIDLANEQPHRAHQFRGDPITYVGSEDFATWVTLP